MKVIFSIITFFLFFNCGYKGRDVSKESRSIEKNDSCIEVCGFYMHKISRVIFARDEYGRKSDVNDTTRQGFHCEVYDISNENDEFFIDQCKRNGYVALPIKDIQIPSLSEYLSPKDSGYYKLTIARGSIFGFNRFLIVNLSKKYFIWYQIG